MDGTQRISLEFREFETFAEIARSFDWSPVQLSRGRLNLKLDLFDAGNFGAFRLAFSPRIHDRTAIWPGYISFSLLMGPCKSFGRDVPPFTLVVLRDNDEYRSTFEPGFSCMEFYCKREWLQAHPLGDLILDKTKSPQDLLFELDTRLAYRIRSILEELISSETILLSGFARDATGTAILNLFENVIQPRLGIGKRESAIVLRTNLFQEALTYLEASNQEPSVEALADALGVSRRALEKAFKNTIGVSPGQFMLARKLTRVRDALELKKGPVIDIAWEEGFEHASRFSAQYARLFLEKPSQTLKRAEAVNSPKLYPGSQIG